jgi:sugar phosphate isomerase/epimerase
MNRTIHPRVCVNALSTWNWTLEQDIAFFTSIGVTNISPTLRKFGADPSAGIEAVKQAGFRCCSLSSGGKSLIDSGEAALQALKPYIDAANALESPSIFFVSGPTPPRMPTDQAYALLVDALPAANNYAHTRGVRLAIEHSSTTARDFGFIHTLADAAALAREADIGVCVELQNCWVERHLDRLFRENVDLFALVQVSDFLVGEPPRLNRRVPGDGSIPLEWLCGHLLDAGYSGYFDIELLGPSIEKEGYASAIRRSVDWLSERLGSWGV